MEAVCPKPASRTSGGPRPPQSRTSRLKSAPTRIFKVIGRLATGRASAAAMCITNAANMIRRTRIRLPHSSFARDVSEQPLKSKRWLRFAVGDEVCREFRSRRAAGPSLRRLHPPPLTRFALSRMSALGRQRNVCFWVESRNMARMDRCGREN